MIVNLTGLPGSGKTTLETYFKSGLRSRGFHVISAGELKQIFIRDTICSQFNRESWMGVFPRLIFLTQPRWYFFRKCLFQDINRLLTEKSRVRGFRLSEDIILSNYFIKEYDRINAGKLISFWTEGLVHHLASMKAWSEDESDLFSLFLGKGEICKKFQIFYLRVPLEEVFTRLNGRGIPSFWRKSTNGMDLDIMEILHKYECAIESTIEEFRDRGANVVTVQNSGDKSKIRDRVEECLNSFMQTSDKRENNLIA